MKKLIAAEGAKYCRSTVGDEGLLRGYLRDGLVHFRVEYVGKIDPLHQEAFRASMAMWNRHSDVTGFVFEEATRTMAVDFRLTAGRPRGVPKTVEGQPVEKTSCTSYSVRGSHIWYSTKIKDWLKNDDDVKNVAKAYAHELGHGLNLDHETGSRASVMREGNKKTPCRKLVEDIIPEIQESDATAAHRCGCISRLMAQGQLQGPVR